MLFDGTGSFSLLPKPDEDGFVPGAAAPEPPKPKVDWVDTGAGVVEFDDELLFVVGVKLAGAATLEVPKPAVG